MTANVTSNRAKAILGLVVLSYVAGCGGSSPYGLSSITGKVVYDDGTPVPGKLGIRFQSLEDPIDSRTHPRPGYAYTDEQGVFEYATTYKHADGIVRGRHRVMIGEIENLGSLIDRKYGDPERTPLEVDSTEAPFEIVVSRPAADPR